MRTKIQVEDAIQEQRERLMAAAREGACEEETWARAGAIEFARESQEGVFKNTLATNGEASDGHILHIPGIQIPETGRLPMLLGHQSHAEIPSLGHLKEFRKQRGPTARLRSTGVINLKGDADDGLLPIRRGVWNLVDEGDLGGMSLRWSGIKVTPRIDLPKGHYAHVDSTEEDYWKRTGLFFEKSQPSEGSIVAVGADPEALIGRAAEQSVEVERVFRGLDLPGRAHVDVETDRLRAAMASCLEAGLDQDGLRGLIREVIDGASGDLVRYSYLDGDDVREVWLPEAALDALRGEPARHLATILAAIDGLGERMTPPAPKTPAPARAPATSKRAKARSVSDMPAEEFFAGLGAALRAATASSMESLTAGKIRR